MASQCALDSGDAAGEVSSMYSTPNSSSLGKSAGAPSLSSRLMKGQYSSSGLGMGYRLAIKPDY